MDTSNQTKPDYHKWVLMLLIGLTLVRIYWLFLTPLNLHGDEAQYWAWSRSFDWGYFSKPPMIAWVIGSTTALFGNEEWAIRLSSPLIHAATAYILFRTGRFMFDARTGFFATCLYFLMPAVWLSSGIVSTDVTLLLFWAIALNAWAHIRDMPTLKWAALLGVAIGLGMLSKYAMLFFILALAIVSIFDRKSRIAMFSRHGLVAAILAIAIVLPNILWNAANDFQTIGHTAANANLKENLFHPAELLEFVVSQFGVFGPVTFLLLIAALVYTMRGKLDRKAVLLLGFVLVPLLAICVQALLSRANANWAVSSYIGGTLLAAHFITRYFTRVGKAGIWLNTVVCAVFLGVALSPVLTNQIGFANSVKRMRGWPTTVDHISAAAKQGHDGKQFSAIATDQRLTFFELRYYGVEEKSGLPLKAWLFSKHIHDHAEANWPLPASTVDEAPILVVNYFQNRDKFLRQDFARLEPLPAVTIELGGGKSRVYYLWAGYGYTSTENYR